MSRREQAATPKLVSLFLSGGFNWRRENSMRQLHRREAFNHVQFIECSF